MNALRILCLFAVALSAGQGFGCNACTAARASAARTG